MFREPEPPAPKEVGGSRHLEMIEETRIAIVGGGVTGLALAYELRRLEVPHVVLEADERPGGVIRSGVVDGHLLEWGPQRTRMTRAIAALVDELGIAGEVVTAPPGLPLYVYHSGRLRRVPFSATDFLRSDIVPFSAKLRLLAEPLTAGADPEERVAGYFTRKVGRSIYENIVGPLYGGLYASDPADMVVGLSLGHVLAEFGIRRSLLLPLLRRGGSIDPPPALSFRDGMATLPRALYMANRPNVRLGWRVESLRGAGTGWVVGGPRGEIRADRVVLSLPAQRAARLLSDSAGQASQSIGQLRYNPLAVVHLFAQTDLRGLGYQISLAEPLLTRGVTFNDSLFDRKGVYTAYLGGAKAPHVVEMEDDEIADAAVREFRQVTGFAAEVLSVEREWMPAWDHTWSAIRDLSLPAGVHVATNWESRPGIPGRLAQAKRLARALAEI